jgi:putative isomerase
MSDIAARRRRWNAGSGPIDGTYYAIDVGVGDPGPVRTPADWAVPLKIRSWVMVMPLWAGIASPERAEQVMRNHICASDQLRSPYGLRSLAICEPSYRIFANYNPSDWCGPVWVVSTYLAFAGLQRYGFTEAAQALATDHLRCLAKDADSNGVLHEYYHPEAGHGMTHPGFVNWNTCAALMATSLGDAAG